MATWEAFKGRGNYSRFALDYHVFNSDGMSDNELIAEFMGALLERPKKGGALWAIYNLPEFCKRINIPENRLRVFYTKDLEFDKSWDWLMPVVEKIEESLLGQVEIHTAYTNINGEFNNKKYNQDSCFESQNDTKLDVTYRAVVKFIKWFQEQ